MRIRCSGFEVVRCSPAVIGTGRDRAVREIGAAGGGQILDEPLLLLQLSAHQRARRRRQRGLVVVAVDPGSRAAVEQCRGALLEDRSRLARVGHVARATQQHVGDVPLGECPLPRRDLEHGGPVLRAARRPDRQGGARRRDRATNVTTMAMIVRRARGANGRKLRERPHAQVTTSIACMPAMKWPDMLQKTSYLPGAERDAQVAQRTRLGGLETAGGLGRELLLADRHAVRAQRQAALGNPDDDELVPVGAAIRHVEDDGARRDPLRRQRDREVALAHLNRRSRPAPSSRFRHSRQLRMRLAARASRPARRVSRVRSIGHVSDATSENLTPTRSAPGECRPGPRNSRSPPPVGWSTMKRRTADESRDLVRRRVPVVLPRQAPLRARAGPISRSATRSRSSGEASSSTRARRRSGSCSAPSIWPTNTACRSRRRRASQRRLTDLAAAEGLEYHLDRTAGGNSFDAHRLAPPCGGLGPAGRAERTPPARLLHRRRGDRPARRARAARRRRRARACRGRRRPGRRPFSEAVRADEQRARLLGINGVPFFAVDERYGISGAQSSDLILSALEQAWSERTQSAAER